MSHIAAMHSDWSISARIISARWPTKLEENFTTLALRLQFLSSLISMNFAYI